MTSPVVHDISEYELVAAAVAALQIQIPELELREGHLETMLLEAMAVQAGQTIYAINQLPEAILASVLAVYDVQRLPAVPAEVDVMFEADVALTTERTLPVGTRVRLVSGPGVSYDFRTAYDVTFNPGALTQYGKLIAVDGGAGPNGLPSTTQVELLDPAPWIETATTTTVVSGGADVEAWATFLARGTDKLSRHTSTLVTAGQFESAARDVAGVIRSKALNRYDPGQPGIVGSHQGHITVVLSDALGNPVSDDTALEVLNYLTDSALAGLTVHVASPELVTMADKIIGITLSPGYTEDEAKDAVEAAIVEYLSPATWPFANYVYPFDIVAVVANLPQVGRVVSVSPDIAEFLSGVAPLPVLGAITVLVYGS